MRYMGVICDKQLCVYVNHFELSAMWVINYAARLQWIFRYTHWTKHLFISNRSMADRTEYSRTCLIRIA